MILAVPSRQSVADSIGPCDILSILLAPIAHASCDDLSPILMAAPLRRPAVDSLAAPLRAPRGDWPQIRSAVPSRIPCFFFFHHPFSQCACPILRATTIFSISFVLKRAAQACAVPASPLAPTGGNPHLLAPGHYCIIFAPTGVIHY